MTRARYRVTRREINNYLEAIYIYTAISWFSGDVVILCG